MQYPIIDLITDAYLNNGWTGLEVTEGKNLLENIASSSIIEGVDFHVNDDGSITGNGLSTGWTGMLIGNVTLKPGVYTLSGGVDASEQYYFYVELYPQYINTRSGNNTFTLESETTFDVRVYARPDHQINNITIYPQLEKGNQATTYAPYAPPTTDIKNRLKLPMIHYFPHPVIDTLQRAAAGTQTAEDTEILRHYLTPLGIGGI